ncbi:MAG: heparinase II/III family protein [Phycisphaerae bacterium]
MILDLPPDRVRSVILDSSGSDPLPWVNRSPEALQRCISVAFECGLMERIDVELADDQPIPVLPYSGFRQFRRIGDRKNYESKLFDRRMQMEYASIACLLGRDKWDYLQDLIWAECESTWWILPAHEAGPAGNGEPAEGPIDLFSAMMACRLAVLVKLLGDRLEPEVVDRIRKEIDRRVLTPFIDSRYTFWWKGTTNNWNAVCNGAVGVAAMLMESNPHRLAEIIADILGSIGLFIDGFTDDGGCTEGPGYWRFGFGWYVRLAGALYDFTNGQINLMQGEKIKRICRYPLAVNVRRGQDLCFADASAEGYQEPLTVQIINRFYDLPELYGLCSLDGNPRIHSYLEALLAAEESQPEPVEDASDYWLPDLQVVKIRAGEVTLAAKAGHNAEHHNHNDIGSFIVHRGKTFFITDPGGPVYSKKTFSKRRYESIYCNSLGHSVPVVCGTGQTEGQEFSGVMQVQGLNDDPHPKITLDLTGAYFLPALSSLRRELSADRNDGTVRITDRFEFSDVPSALEDVFITCESPELHDGASAVAIRSESDGTCLLRAEQAGTFSIDERREESIAESRTGDIIRRLVFTPETLERTMTLQFSVEWK